MSYIDPSDTKAIAIADQKEHEEITLPMLMTLEPLTVASAESYGHDCHTDFHAVHNSGTRPLNVITAVVVHSTEGGTAKGVAQYFTDRNSGGSTQLVVDDFTCYRCLTDEQIPWGAPGMNYCGIHIEQCGYAKWTTSMWETTHRRTLLRAAWKTAYNCRKYGIRPYFLDAAKLKAGRRNGVTTHAECSKAFGGTHVDPGTGWPRLLFMTMVRMFWAGMKIRVLA